MSVAEGARRTGRPTAGRLFAGTASLHALLAFPSVEVEVPEEMMPYVTLMTVGIVVVIYLIEFALVAVVARGVMRDRRWAVILAILSLGVLLPVRLFNLLQFNAMFVDGKFSLGYFVSAAWFAADATLACNLY